MSLQPDDDIVILFRNQEPVATRQLYDWFYRPLCYYAEKIVNNSQEAEDIVVEIFIKLLKKNTDFDTLAAIKSFLYTATHNACIDFYRKQKRHQRSHEEISYLTDTAASFQEVELINAEVMAAFYTEIEQLPAQCAQVFKLLFFQRLTPAQAAQQLHITTKTVLNQKGKAVQLLRKALLKKGLLHLGILLALCNSVSH